MAEQPAPLQRPHRLMGVTKVICTANIPVALSNQLRQRAVDDDVTLSSLVEEALTAFLGPHLDTMTPGIEKARLHNRANSKETTPAGKVRLDDHTKRSEPTPTTRNEP